jgi:AraC-like DNA-binding protein
MLLGIDIGTSACKTTILDSATGRIVATARHPLNYLYPDSVRAEIEQVRLARVLTLLAETDTPLGVVADMCGFGSEVELRQIFRKRVRTSMKEWRALHR